jgi:hypothetical protein
MCESGRLQQHRCQIPYLSPIVALIHVNGLSTLPRWTCTYARKPLRTGRDRTLYSYKTSIKKDRCICTLVVQVLEATSYPVMSTSIVVACSCCLLLLGCAVGSLDFICSINPSALPGLCRNYSQSCPTVQWGEWQFSGFSPSFSSNSSGSCPSAANLLRFTRKKNVSHLTPNCLRRAGVTSETEDRCKFRETRSLILHIIIVLQAHPQLKRRCRHL